MLGSSVVGSGAGTQLSVVVNVPMGDVCAVAVTNPDGSAATYQSIAATGASPAFSAFEAGPSLALARGALQAAVGNATSAQRFLYALGGNGGTAVLSSLESTPLGLSGSAPAFSAIPGNLAGQGSGGFTLAPDGGLIETAVAAPRERGRRSP